ncbi:putative DNA repair protein RecN [Streptomyces afghaniensis 772]|uniref:Putative DNA repair protein RecN n=1 Tax=Streptomyces afghaniensis 772 TaxID=1283301 RepID=S4MSZ7_9ACTN|nr:putative DNA repair protein RecN [Streptomyces afghaniensis 772]
MRDRGGGRQRLGVPQPLGLLGQLHVLAGPGLDGRDLVEPVAEHVGLLGPLTRPRGDLVELGGDGPQPLVGLAVLGQRHGDRVTGVPVERLPLPGQLEQPLLVRLPVHGHQLVGELGEHPHGHTAPAQVRPRAPLGGNGTADQQRPVVELGPGLLGAYGGRGVVRDGDPPLHDGLPGPDPHESRVRTPAQQQPEAGDHHGLARTRLTGDRGEPGRQLDDSVVDHAERPYPHLLQHGHDLTRSGQPIATGPSLSPTRVDTDPKGRGELRDKPQRARTRPPSETTPTNR